MITKPFSTLTERECAELLAFMRGLSAQPPCPDLASMGRSLSAPGFEGGRTFLTVWSDEGTLCGTVGVVTREVVARGEAFLTSVFVERERAGILPCLLLQAYKLLAVQAPPGTIVRLGLREESDYLRVAVLEAGFRECYRVLELRRAAAEPVPADLGLTFAPVSAETLPDFVTVHNAAFLTSPNGGQVSAGEVAEAATEAAAPDLLQVGYLAGVPVTMFELRLEDDTGWIDGLGVHPDHQGRGFGRASLRRALATLLAHGVTEVRLRVVEANATALALYREEGFVQDKVVSTFFVISLAEALKQPGAPLGQ